MDMWLLGRKHPLRVHGLTYTIDRFETMLNLYDWAHWPNFFPVEFHRLEDEYMQIVLEQEDMRILASPVRHLMPTMGLRLEFTAAGKTAAYSCDTEPCEAVVELGSGADVLVHEATGAQIGHSSAAQAGEVARQAGAKELYLIHYDPRLDEDGQAQLVKQARQTFRGRVELAKDFIVIDI
jgi:ribonuclease Z